jgi:hypothetical protein
MTKMED